MNQHELFSYSAYQEQTHLAEQELSAFIDAATDLFGAEDTRFAREEWLDEANLIDIAPCSIGRDWRSVSTAASARLAGRLDALEHHHQPSAVPSTDTNALPILSSNCLASVLLV